MNQPNPKKTLEQQDLDNERNEVLLQLEDWLELPVLVLGFFWLVLLVVDLLQGLNPFLSVVVEIIWGIFVLDFILRLILAPRKTDYLKKNWLTALSLVIPALRILRILRFERVIVAINALRNLRLVRVVASLNRGMRNLRLVMRRRRFGYIVLLTGLVTLVSSAAMLAFEGDHPQGFENFGAALYWTAMMITTLGSDYTPLSPEGKIMSFLLALYAFAIFGYVTATLATYFIGRDAENDETELAGEKSVEALRTELQALRLEIQALSANLLKPSEDETS